MERGQEVSETTRRASDFHRPAEVNPGGEAGEHQGVDATKAAYVLGVSAGEFNPVGHVREVARINEDFPWLCERAQACCEVHGPTGIIIGLQHERFTVRETATQLEWQLLVPPDEFHCCGEGLDGVNANKHDAVAEPF